MRKRRLKKFLDEFPNAVDVIVRGVKAGLPLDDCLRIIAAEAAEPVAAEFRKIVEDQTLGMPLRRGGRAAALNAFRCPKRTSSRSSSPSSSRPAAISPRRSATCRAFCASARR